MMVAKRISSVVLSVFIFIFAFASLFLGIFKFELSNADYYVNMVANEKFTDVLYNDIDNSIKSACEILEVDYGTVMKYVEKSEICRLSRESFSGIFNTVLYGEEFKPVKFENPDMKDEIFVDLQAFAIENNISDESIENSTEETYKFFVDRINSFLNFFTEDELKSVSFISRFTNSNFMTGVVFYISVIIYVALSVAKMLLFGKKRILHSFYNLFFVSWLASALYFIPITVLKLQNIPEKLVVASSGLRVLIQNIINLAMDSVFYLSLIPFVAFGVAFIVSVVFVVRRLYSNYNESTEDVRH